MAGGRVFAPSSWIGLKSTYVWKKWFIKWAENERLLLNGCSSLRFTKKFELVFVLTEKNVQRFHFKTNKKSISFLVKSTEIKSVTFPYKTALSEINVKTNRMCSTKWTYQLSGVLPITTLFLWKFCFSLKTSNKELIWCTNYSNAHIHTFRKRWSFIWGRFFPASILKFVNLFNMIENPNENFCRRNTCPMEISYDVT